MDDANDGHDEGEYCGYRGHCAERSVGKHLIFPPSWATIGKLSSGIVNVIGSVV